MKEIKCFYCECKEMNLKHFKEKLEEVDCYVCKRCGRMTFIKI